MAEVVAWNRETSRADLERARQMLRDGGIVAVPTETGYLAALDATCAQSVSIASEFLYRPMVLLAEPTAITEWLPGITPIGKRLCRKLWPGPVSIEGSDGKKDGKMAALPEAVCSFIDDDNAIRLCVPLHEVPWQLAIHENPLLLCHIGSNSELIANADRIAQEFGDKIELVFDDGMPPVSKPATMVQLSGNQWKVIHDGAIPSDAIENAACCRVVFVCTGNTCRSPMAEALFRKELAAELNCAPVDLLRQGYIVQSAGITATPGNAAAPEAVRIVNELDGDLQDHSSCALTMEILVHADYLLAMTSNHVLVLTEYLAPDSVQPNLLSLDGENISDPIGGSEEVYRECAQQILQCVKVWVKKIQQEEATVRGNAPSQDNG